MTKTRAQQTWDHFNRSAEGRTMQTDGPKYLPLQLKRGEQYEELAKLQGRTLAEHEGYPRTNDGEWIVTDAQGERFCVVAFKGKAKRGQAWNTPDPEGQQRARDLIAAMNSHAELLEVLKRLVDHPTGELWQKATSDARALIKKAGSL